MLSALVDKPLIQNPLAGGSMTSPQESQLQGDSLVQQMQMRMQQRDIKTPAFLAFFKDVMNTKGYPTKTMQQYESQFPATTPQQVPLGANMLMGANMLNVTPPEEGIMQLQGGNTGTISQITQPDLIGKQYSEGELAPGIKTVNPIVNNPLGTNPNSITSVAEQQGLNITNTEGLNKFVDNMINNRLKEFFGGIMSMLNV